MYISGQWLRNDRLHREALHLKFDHPALCKKAIQACPGATKIVKQERKYVSSNRIFIGQWLERYSKGPVQCRRHIAIHPGETVQPLSAKN
jgi:hypothetical protein